MKGIHPIGVFDSGSGGLTVLARLMAVMPSTPFCYFADAAWCPYGPRSVDEVRMRVVRAVEYLQGLGCCMVVVACNTATAMAIAQLRANFMIPFVGMEPAVKPAAIQSQTGLIGVLATRGTLEGEKFQQAAELYSTHAEILYAEGKGLVELVEQGVYDGPEVRKRLSELIDPLVQKGIDHLVLGCTHYPFLAGALRAILPSGVAIVDPAPAVALQAKRVRESFCPWLRNPQVGGMGGIRLFSSAAHGNLPGQFAFFLDSIGLKYSIHQVVYGVEI